MISSMALPARMAEPAVGAGFDAGRLARAIDELRRRLPGAAGRRAAAAAPLARRRRLRDRGRDRPAARRPRARTSSGSGRTPGICAGPASTRRRSSAATPTGSAASTSRTASPTILIKMPTVSRHQLPRGGRDPAAVGGARPRRGRLRRGAGRDPGRLRRRLHDRGRRAERRVEARVASDLLRVGQEPPLRPTGSQPRTLVESSVPRRCLPAHLGQPDECRTGVEADDDLSLSIHACGWMTLA